MKIKNSKTKKIIKYLLLGSGLITLSVLAPQLPYNLLKCYLRQKKFQKGRFISDLKRLQDKKLISYHELDNGSIKIILQKAGKEKALQYKFEDLKIDKSKKWDRKWRLVIFDIPNSQSKARDALRRKIKELGFYQLQRSVFINPYPCEDEIDFVASVFNVRKYILIMYISYFEGEEKMKHYFSID